MDGDRLPATSAPPSATVPAQSGGSGAVVPLPPLPGLPGLPPPDPFFSVPEPLLPTHGHSVFLTATPDELLAGLEEATAIGAAADTSRPMRSGPWRPPPAAYRVGSFIRNHRLCIHMRGCTKCREEGALAFRAASVSRARDQSTRRSDAGSGRRRRRSSSARKRGGSARSKSPGKKCSSLCVHPSTKGRRSSKRRSSSRSGRRSRSGKSSRSGRGARSGQADGAEFLLPHGSELLLPTDIKRLTVYHNREFTQMTWEELMALLTTNFHQYPDISEEQIRQMEEIKAEIIEKIQAGRIRAKDARLRWKTREMMLTEQLTQLSRARDMYRAILEAVSEHSDHLRRLPTLLEVRAFRQVHALNTDYLKAGCTLLRFTQVPGRLCRGINLYQACVALVVGRRWVLIVLRRRLRRISERTDGVNTAIDAVLRYKFQQLPTDRMRVSHLLTKLDGLTRWFDDVKAQMLSTVHTLHEDLETRRQQQIEETIVAAMDAEVESHEDWKHLYDFNRCLAGLVDDMTARNSLLRGMIEETRRGARRRGRDDREWHAWLLQEKGQQPSDGRLNICRTRWMPV